MKKYNYSAKARKFMRLMNAGETGHLTEEEMERRFQKEVVKPWPDMKSDITLALEFMVDYFEIGRTGKYPTAKAPLPPPDFGENDGPPWMDEMLEVFLNQGVKMEIAVFRTIKANAVVIKSMDSISEKMSQIRGKTGEESLDEFLEQYFLPKAA